MATWQEQEAERQKQRAGMPQIGTWADIIAPAIQGVAAGAPAAGPAEQSYVPQSPREFGAGIRNIPDAISRFLLDKWEIPAVGEAEGAINRFGSEFMAGLTGEEPAPSMMGRKAPAAGRSGSFRQEAPPEPMGPPRPPAGGAGGFGQPSSLGPFNPPRMKVPETEETPYADMSGIQQQLEALRPHMPEMLSKNDMILSTLGGLAAGAANAPQGARFGQILAGAGAAGIGAQQGAKQENYRRTQQYEEQMREHGMVEVQSNAQDVLARHNVDVQNIAARNRTRAAEAVADFEYEKSVMPQFHVDSTGTTVLWRDAVTGMMNEKRTVSPQFALNMIAEQAKIRAATLRGMSGGKVSAKISIPGIGEIDADTLGPLGHRALSAFAWAGYSGEARAEKAALLKDIDENPEAYGAEGMAIRMAKLKEQDEWATKRVAATRLDKILAEQDPNKYAELVEQGLAWVSDYQEIKQRRMFPMAQFQQEATTADDPMANWMSGLVPTQ